MAMPANVKKYLDKYWDIYEVGTLPPGGQLAMSQINGEFGRGNSLGNYSGTQWWTDTYGQTGTFSNPLGFDQFWGKRGSSPPPPYLLQATLYSRRGSSGGGFVICVGFSNGSIGYLGAMGDLQPRDYPGSQVTAACAVSPLGQRIDNNFATNNSADNWSTVEYVGLSSFSRGQYNRVNGYWEMRSVDPGLRDGGNYTMILR